MLQHSVQSPTKPIRVGFDLDGVLLYNPTRTFRPIISWIKRELLGRKQTKFFVPKTYWQRQFFIWAHKSSLWIAPGLDDIKDLAEAGLIEPYLITARYDFLKADLDKWLQKMAADQIFVDILYNKNNEQPFIFKAKQIQRFQLEIFVEDNWDVVKKIQELVTTQRPKFVCWWVSNILDWSQSYPYKAMSLEAVLIGILQQINSKKIAKNK